MRISLCCLAGLLPFSLAVAGLVEEPAACKTLGKPDVSTTKDEAKRRKSELKDDDLTLCWIRGKHNGGAVPFRFFLNAYRVISDPEAVFVHDPDAGFARIFVANGDFRFHGWRNGVMVIKHKNGSLYSALTGLAFAGANKGKRLPPVPAITTTWGWWLKHYPDSFALQIDRKFTSVDQPKKAHPSSVKSRVKLDDRLNAEERILGVVTGEQAKAYRLADLKTAHILHDTIDGRTVHVLYDVGSGTATAFNNRAVLQIRNVGLQAPDAIELSYDGRNTNAPFKDRTTGSSFDITGRCVAGKLKGYELTWIDSVAVKWYAWVAEYPDTAIYGKK